MKAQSDLTGDRESAAEMTAPRICAVTTWMDAINEMKDPSTVFSFRSAVNNDSTVDFSTGFTPDPFLIATAMKDNANLIDFSEVTPLPPAAATPRVKSR